MEAALSLARLCYELLIEHGLRAKLAVEKGAVTEDVEKIVEANILLSGLGFESSGLAAAHSIHNGFTALEETHHYYHGEKVAFGTLVQLVLENRNSEELEEVLSYCKSVGLPVALRQIGITDASPEKIRKVAESSCAEGETIFNMPFLVTAEMFYDAILAANRIGEQYLPRKPVTRMVMLSFRFSYSGFFLGSGGSAGLAIPEILGFWYAYICIRRLPWRYSGAFVLA